jgi:hypothetical protein
VPNIWQCRNYNLGKIKGMGRECGRKEERKNIATVITIK